jgi:hypothetical protein
MKRSGLIALIIFYCCPAPAQRNECYNTLREANKTYYKGDMNEVIKLLTPCLLSGGYRREDAAQAYRLLALAYLVLNEPAKADSAIRKLLEHNHNYQKYPNMEDGKEFTKLVNSYEILNKFWLGGKAGFNLVTISHVVNYAVSNTPSSYTMQTNYFMGLLAEYKITKSYSVSMDILYNTLSYRHQVDNVAGWKQIYHEDLSYLSIPLNAKYTWLQWKVKPYAELGTDISFLQSVNSNIEAIDNTYGTATNTSVNSIDRRNKTYIGVFGGIGISYKIGGLTIFGNTRYIVGLTKIVSATRRYDDLGFILEKQYVDDDFRLSNFQLAAGFRLPVWFKVKKIQVK